MAERYLTRNVFVAGGEPEVTYNPRDEFKLEQEVREYLDQSGKALSISGPSKSGKTVLIGRVLPKAEAIWIYGQDLTSVDVFWESIVDWLGLYDEVEMTDGVQNQGSAQIGMEVGFAGFGKATGSGTVGGATTHGRRFARQRSIADVARGGLATLAVPIVIDDFHYVDDAVKRDIARAIKSLLPTTHVIMIAVPHEAFQIVREEPDMGGRVWHQQIRHWDEDELRFIARMGFEALGIIDDGEVVAAKLAENSFGAPFLMQQLCYDLTVGQHIQQTQDEPVALTEPPSGWDDFFKRIAMRTAPPIFEKVRRGPKVRGQERMERQLKDGSATDIYPALLMAIAHTGPQTVLTQPQIMKSLDGILVENPRGRDVASSLSSMADIAEEERGTADPALVYKNDELHILDPFLCFFMRWGTWATDSYTGTR
ncbi:ATP-binding protein [Blastococcus saxobsidens]|uniref:ATP-binding protein n=1 Tax=Blastococcus saxobsidens TaxID=138336 RepID=A0A6L9W0E4_9ACTN|nr:ATP-binding protein [Blastococcus saxobsidens]NEK85418.1 ATP-binding protein [Blastococcus saxobsidens]NEK87610.1 ATP-binding protein [Blastococcus saxobsidens]